jgi:hypothetical protein
MSDWRTLHELRRIRSAVEDPTGKWAFYKAVIILFIVGALLFPKVKQSYDKSRSSAPWPVEKALKYSNEANINFCGTSIKREKNREQCGRIAQNITNYTAELNKKGAAK